MPAKVDRNKNPVIEIGIIMIVEIENIGMDGMHNRRMRIQQLPNLGLRMGQMGMEGMLKVRKLQREMECSKFLEPVGVLGIAFWIIIFGVQSR
jgi:hypothetical protein